MRSFLTFRTLFIHVFALVSLVFSQVSFAAPINLSEEIEATRNTVQLYKFGARQTPQRISDLSLLERYLNYLEILNIEFTPVTPSPATVAEANQAPLPFDTTYRDWIKTGFKTLDAVTKTKVTPESLKQLHDIAEGNNASQTETTNPDTQTIIGKTEDGTEWRFALEIYRSFNNEIYVFSDLRDRYLGDGANKYVWKVLRLSDWEDLAGCFLRSDLPNIESGRRTFLQEMDNLEKVRECESPFLINALDRGDDFIIQSLYSGDLFGAVESRSLTTEQKVDITVKIARGLVAFHEKGWVHLDIKLENVFLAHDRSPVIGDLGYSYNVAEHIRSQSPFPHAVGTPGYLPPESRYFGNRNWIGASEPEKIENAQKQDLFAYGVVLSHLWDIRSPSLRWTYFTGEEIEKKGPRAFNYSRNRSIQDILKIAEATRNDSARSLESRVIELIADTLNPDVSKRLTASETLERALAIQSFHSHSSPYSLPRVRVPTMFTDDPASRSNLDLNQLGESDYTAPTPRAASDRPVAPLAPNESIVPPPPPLSSFDETPNNLGVGFEFEWSP